jgi:hypothetical protein
MFLELLPALRCCSIPCLLGTAFLLFYLHSTFSLPLPLASVTVSWNSVIVLFSLLPVAHTAVLFCLIVFCLGEFSCLALPFSSLPHFRCSLPLSLVLVPHYYRYGACWCHSREFCVRYRSACRCSYLTVALVSSLPPPYVTFCCRSVHTSHHCVSLRLPAIICLFMCSFDRYVCSAFYLRSCRCWVRYTVHYRSFSAILLPDSL